jgi:hypothetical protein
MKTLVTRNECWFRRLTPAFAKRYAQYKPFVGMFLVMECTDNLEQGAVVTETMILSEQQHHAKLRKAAAA